MRVGAKTSLVLRRWDWLGRRGRKIGMSSRRWCGRGFRSLIGPSQSSRWFLIAGELYSLIFAGRIWSECSGATDAREPGLYQDLLSQHAGQENLCLTQIDMDCQSASSSTFRNDADGFDRSSNLPDEFVLRWKWTWSRQATQCSHRLFLEEPYYRMYVLSFRRVRLS